MPPRRLHCRGRDHRRDELRWRRMPDFTPGELPPEADAAMVGETVIFFVGEAVFYIWPSRVLEVRATPNEQGWLAIQRRRLCSKSALGGFPWM